MSDMHDHIIVFAKQARWNKNDTSGWSRRKLTRAATQESRYENKDSDPRGDWTSADLTCNKTSTERPNLYYPIKNPITGDEVWPSESRVWGYEAPVMAQMMLENRIWWGLDGKNKPRLKIFRCEVDDGVVPSTWWTREQAGDNQDAKRELRTLFDGVEVFDTPKPTRLLERILDIATSGEQGEIVLDFFAGSGTTGDAVMRKNASDGGVRRHISVQLPEELEPPVSLTKGPQLKTISDVTKERLRRAAKSIAEENLGSPGDTGFRVFKLHTSNIRAWDPARDDIARSLEDAAEHLRADRTEQDILFELLLKLGLDLTVPIEAKQIAGKSVHSIGAGVLMVCLDKKIGPKDVEPLAHGIAVWHKALSPAGETTIVFRDSAFVDDVAKTNISAILQQHGLENLRSL